MKAALLENEARVILESRGVNNVPGEFCKTKEGVFAAAERLGYPVVIKVVSHQVVHKSDVGGVKVNLHDAQELADAYDQMMESIERHVPDAVIEGVLVTKYIAKAREIIVGALRDPQFGPVVMVGLGGIFTEVFHDTSFGIAPINKREAMRMIKSLKSYPVLEGIRGQKPVDFDAVCDLMVKVSQFVYETEVEELDLNPVFCLPENALVGDARILMRTGESAPTDQ